MEQRKGRCRRHFGVIGSGIVSSLRFLRLHESSLLLPFEARRFVDVEHDDLERRFRDHYSRRTILFLIVQLQQLVVQQLQGIDLNHPIVDRPAASCR